MRHFTLVLLASLLASTAVQADTDWDRHDRPRWNQRDMAIIRNVTPQYEQVAQTRQECRSEWVSETVPAPKTNYAGTILGGVTGGVIGHQIGKGRGKTVATVAGTLIGAMIGDHVSDPYPNNRAEVVDREVQRCRPVNEYTQRVRDYRVDYEYRSQIYSTTMNTFPGQPGERIPVKVMVELDQ
jgi:uncharacterized protein YcfJ